MSGSLKEVGIIIGEASSSEFWFSSKPADMPSRWEYLMTYSEEDYDGQMKRVEVVAQIERVLSASLALTRELDFDIIKKIIDSGLADNKVWGKARVLGYLTATGELQLPKRAVCPGKPVFIAPTELLEKFYSYPKDEAINVGSLITRSEVPVALSTRGFRRHMALLAQTGSGKTYLAGILANELLKKGGTLVIIDPHADYVFLGRSVDGERHELSDRITVFRNPSSTGRYSEGEVGQVDPYEICFSDLDFDEMCLICGIDERFVKIRSVFEQALDQLRQAEMTVFNPRDVLEQLQNARNWPSANRALISDAKSAEKYVKRLVKMKVFTDTSTSIDKMLRPRFLSVVDLSGLNNRAADYIAFRLLSDIYDKVSNGEFEYPVFVFIEEAHKFVPAKGHTHSSSVINRIAAEGRKFGVFLVVITQRPSKIHADALSQCNSQIVMRMTNPEDQLAIARSSERLGETLLNDLPGLNTGEAVLVGEMTRAPVMVKVKKRRTKEGGSDIDIVGKMKQAIKEAAEETPEKDSERLREELQGFMIDKDEK